nr:MAG TPA: hypothetical protein [Caudoviricetes sp.]
MTVPPLLNNLVLNSVPQKYRVYNYPHILMRVGEKIIPILFFVRGGKYRCQITILYVTLIR